MTILLPRAVTPGPAFLAEVAVSYALGTDGRAYAMLGHPEAHARRATSVERHLRGIAAGLGLHQGETYPPTQHLLYHARGTWALDYGHPDTLLRLPEPPPAWALRTQTYRAAHIGVCLDPALPPSRPDRVLTGTVGFRADRHPGG
ncbi:hypothetical protein [Streptomyces sp. NPDC090022]|uniref:hypothetical protein n=1 Tax=Streptomyces sp. NPDC090022 TaxID=3365920 RepID=UPI00382AC55B